MYTSEVIYLGGLRTQAKHMISESVMITDAPIDNQGKGEAFSPTDLLATSLAQCMMTIMGIEAVKLDVNLTGSKIEVTKKMTVSPRKVAKIDIVFYLPESAFKYKIELEHAALNCPVALSLNPELKQHVVFNYV
jgi:putative redox protein